MQALDPKDRCVLLTAKVTELSPASVKLQWPLDSKCVNYIIERKERSWSSFNYMEELSPSESTWTDTLVETGIHYEYKITKKINDSEYAYGFVSAAIQMPVNAVRGSILLLIDSTMLKPLSTELQTLESDLWNEGWIVSRMAVARTPKFDSGQVHIVKNNLRQWYMDQNGMPSSCFIIGRVAVPYSGMVYGGQPVPGPDGHPEHSGAWAADTYYSCMIEDALWTDNIDNTHGVYPDNRNKPDDGRFDNYLIPGYVDLKLGRVDMYNMGLFYKDSAVVDGKKVVDSVASEISLIRDYLNRDHAYRVGVTPIRRRGLIDDNFKGYPESFSRSAWMSYSALVGPDSIKEVDYISTLDTAQYLWSYGCGGGGSDFQSCGGVGTSTDLSKRSNKTIFSMLFGSYFGDWDKANNLLRAPLAVKGGALTNCWAGRPFWYFHPMALGETMGDIYQATGNKDALTADEVGVHCVHLALLGDPTLRMRYGTVPAPTELSLLQVTKPDKKIIVKWNSAFGGSVTQIVGYYVYRQVGNGPIEVRNDAQIVTDTMYIDPEPVEGSVRFIVRAVGLLRSSSGSFQELSAPLELRMTLTSVETSEIASAQSVQCQPNPGTSSTSVMLNLERAGSVQVDIYDMRGQLVRHLQSADLSAGQQRLVWDLRDDHAQRVAEGMYLVRLLGEGRSTACTVAVIH